jgi:deoxyribodipyrimidine photo-lyase
VWLALQVRDSGIGTEDDRETWLEELVVRRELAHNYVTHEADYDRYRALPAWARQTLAEHRDDDREHVYSYEDLRLGRTHDRAWNAAQAQVREEGFLHNHLRMYWGKQVVKWTGGPQAAFAHLLRLNNEHFLDGRSPNSFANVAWIFGLHDRAWQETAVAGKTRPMTRSGLESKIGKRRLRAWMHEVEERHGPLSGD